MICSPCIIPEMVRYRTSTQRNEKDNTIDPIIY